MASTAFQLACPHCSARLRIKDKSFAGRTVNCPDCRRPLTIQAGTNGELVGVVAVGPAPGGAALEPEPAVPVARRSSPATWIAWGIALAGFAAMLIFVVRRGDDAKPTADVPAVVAPPTEPAPEQPTEPQPETEPTDAGNPAQVVGAPAEPEPTEPEPTPVVEPPPAEPASSSGPDAAPLEVVLAPDEPAFDIDAALDQPLVGFDQPAPTPAGELLKLVGELAGVAVDTTQLSAAAAERLKHPVTLSLNGTTVRGVLDATTEAAGLSYSLGEGSVVVIDRDSESR